MTKKYTKEELKELLKGRFEECSEEEALSMDSEISNSCILISGDLLERDIYFKPVEQFPLIFEGENYQFVISKEIGNSFNIKQRRIEESQYFTDKDIKANQDALDKLKELRQ